MVIRRRHLNEPLQELFEVGFCDQPERLPRLVSFPELARIEVVDALEEVGPEVGFSHWLLRCSVARLLRESVRATQQLSNLVSSPRSTAERLAHRGGEVGGF